MGPLEPDDPERVGSYRLLARLGTGGMGVVYLARTPGGRAVAVKVVRARFAADPQFRARFRREVAAARSVTGVSTAAVLDADADTGQPWLATAYLPGMTLQEAVRTVGPLPPATLRVLAAAMAEALVDIHRVGLVHRDLKPANVMVADDGVRVIDFGIARPEDATAITRVGSVVGTPGFMSPEQVTGAPVGPPSDVFSFGSVLVFAATGREPFRGDAVDVTLHRVRTVAVDLGTVGEPWLRDLVGACLRADPGTRPTAAGLLDRFGHDGADAGWLPPQLAEEIDRRTGQVARYVARHEEARDTPEPPGPHETGPPEVESDVAGPSDGGAGAATVDPVADHGSAASTTRRRVLLGGAAVLTCVTVGLAWERGRDRPDGAAPPTTPPAPTAGASAAPPRATELWRTKVSDYFPSALYAVPGVVLADTGEQELVAVDAVTGRELWRHDATLAGAAAGGMVFQTQSINPELALIDAVSGATRWSRPTGPRNPPVRVAVNATVICYGFNQLTAVHTDDGRRLWTAEVDAERGLFAVADVLVAVAESTVVAVDAATGRVRWQVPVDNIQEFSGGEGLVFLVDGPRRDLHVLDATTGTPVWNRPAFIASCGPLVRDSTVYAAGGRGEIFALDPATGREIWSQAIDRSADLMISGDTICAVATKGVLFGLRPTDGRLLWTFTADMARDPRIDTGVTTSLDGRFYVGVREGEVIAIAGPGTR